MSGLRRLSAARGDLGGQLAAGPSEGMICRLTGRGPLVTGSGGVLMGPEDRGVDRDDPVEVAFGVGLGDQGDEQAIPGTVGGPLPRWSRHRPSRFGVRSGSNGSILAQWASVQRHTSPNDQMIRRKWSGGQELMLRHWRVQPRCDRWWVAEPFGPYVVVVGRR